MNTKTKFSAWIFILLGLASCSQPFYDRSYEVDAQTLSYEDHMDFEFDVQDTQQYYSVWLELEHDEAYPYQNIYLELQSIAPQRDTFQEAFSIDLANKFGYWQGQCSGNKCTIQVPLESKVRFENEGLHVLSIRQHTRMPQLEGIHKVRLTIEEVES